MNLAFWIVSAVLVILALALVLWPLLRGARAPGTAAQTALLKDQLDALKAAHAAGLVADADFEARRKSLSAAALALIDAPQSASARAPLSVRVTAVLVILLLPLLTLVLYQQIGSPSGLAFSGPAAGGVAGNPGSGMPTDASGAPDLSKAADTLAAKLAANPNDGEGWMLLGRTYRATERFAEAKAAFEKARALVPENADLLAESAEVMGLSAQPRSLAGEPEQLLDRALELDGNNQNALFLKGLARAQADDPGAAEQTWEKLLTMMDVGSEAQISVIDQLNVVRKRLGKDALPVPAAADGSSTPPMVAAEPPAASAGPAAGIDVAVAISPELASRVEANDVLFVFARADAGPPMPLAIQRLSAAQLPVELKLDESMGMVAGMSMANFERVVIGARVSKSGNAQGQPGDLETLSAPIEWRKAGKVSLTIDKVR